MGLQKQQSRNEILLGGRFRKEVRFEEREGKGVESWNEPVVIFYELHHRVGVCWGSFSLFYLASQQ